MGIESGLGDRVLGTLLERRERLLEGKLNRIPSPFRRFSRDFVGIERDKYYLVTGSTKSGKSQFTSYAFIYEPLMYCYRSKADVDMRVLYFPLEETPEGIMRRFISWLLYDMTGGKVRVSPSDLMSVVSPVSQEVLDLIKGERAQDIIRFFEERVIFPESRCTPTGIYWYCKKWAEEHGVTHLKPAEFTDANGQTVEYEGFDWYEQDNPDEYRLVVIDTINLVEPEKGLDLKRCMDRLSEYCAKYLRNRYHFSPVIIQQQSLGQEGDTRRQGPLTPSVAGAGDSRTIMRDANMALGLFSPFKFGMREHMGYDVTVFKDSLRFLNVILNRDGEMGGVCPLLFQGDVCDFKELPRPGDPGMDRVYAFLGRLEKERDKS